MRWPLRNQILLPMTALILVTLLGVSLTSVALAVRRTQGQIEGQLRDVARTLAESRFPLTSSVLLQMRGLSGAEFILADEAGLVSAASRRELQTVQLDRSSPLASWDQLQLNEAIAIGEVRYFHTPLQLQSPGRAPRPHVLHILYPERSYRDAIREAVFPPAAIGSVALVVAVLLGVGVASRVSRPIAQLQSQVGRIARGDFQPLPLPQRNDEILDLARATNHMAEMLAHYETEIRRSEQLRTLGQLGGGIAHQLRNAVTGCRMALDLHRRECPLNADCESLDVAVRQLALMEQHLRRFLSLGNLSQKPHQPVNLAAVVESVLPLVRPAAAHVGVEIEWQAPLDPLIVHGDSEALEQLLINLLVNAVEATSAGDSTAPRDRRVVIELRSAPPAQAVLEVRDTGPGPAPQVRQSLFEPLVTEKPDGIGLGLTVARTVAQQHDGQLRWERRDGMTCFHLEIPLEREEQEIASIASR